MRDVFAREGLLVNRKSLPKPTRDIIVCRAGYMRVADELARRDLVTVDVDFRPKALLSVPVRRDSRRLGAWQARNVPLADTYEIMAGKIAALLDRGQARDLYDVSLLPRADWLDFPRLQDAFLRREARRGWNRRRSAPVLSFDSARYELTCFLCCVKTFAARPTRKLTLWAAGGSPLAKLSSTGS